MKHQKNKSLEHSQRIDKVFKTEWRVKKAMQWKEIQAKQQSLVFKKVFQEWQKAIKDETEKKGTQSLFAYLLHHQNKAGKNCWSEMEKHDKIHEPHNHNTISKWLSGKTTIEYRNIKAICELCGVSEEIFSPDYFGGLDYEEAHNEETKKLRDYSEKINLPIDFIRYIHSIPNIVNSFPFHISYGTGPEDSICVVNSGSEMEFTDSSGNCQFLSFKDIDFLKKIYDEIDTMAKRIIELEFYKEKSKVKVYNTSEE